MQKARSMNIQTYCVAFDQPLWLKATDIIKDASLDMVCRISGFLTLMTILGSLGNMMKGSGLEELFAEVYASLNRVSIDNSTDNDGIRTRTYRHNLLNFVSP